MSTATLTAAQLQHLTNNRGQILSPAIQNALRASGFGGITTAGGTTRAQLITTRPSGAIAVSAAASGGQQTMLRPQVVRTALPRQPAPNRMSSGSRNVSPIVIQAGASQTRQQIVVAGSGQLGGALTHRQIVMTHPSGAVRPGQIVQVTGQGGQQHQIVVSQGGGQFIINQQPVVTSQQQQQQSHQQQQQARN
jgi:hypothetical protein